MRFFERPWDMFYSRSIERLMQKPSILDIGGGLRIDSSRNNRTTQGNTEILRRLKERNITYRVLDYTDTYHPDVVGDVQNLPLTTDSEDAIACIAVLEHVEDPIKASAELYRVLKPGGYCFIFVPFLYYYHAERGYYGDYWRFTPDSLKFLFKPFRSIEISPVRGPVETLVRLSPLGRYRFFEHAGFLLDRLLGKGASRQVSGYHVFLEK